MPGRHAAPAEEPSHRSPEVPDRSSVPAFPSRRALRAAERLAAAESSTAAVVSAPAAVVSAPAGLAPAPDVRRGVAFRRPAGPLASVGSASRLAATVAAPAKQHHPVGIKRMALVLAPALAITTGIAFAAPANADPLPTHFQQVEQQHDQRFRVTSNVSIPVMDDGTTTIVSVPSVVVSGGATAEQAQATLGRALSAGGDRAKLLQVALTYLGDTYVEGGATHQGIDCSGLVMVAYQSVGIQLAHYVPTQDAAATTIPESEAKPGDLVVYDNEDHIGLYLGDGLVLQAPHPGEPVDIIPMFPAAHHFARVLPAGS